MVADRNDGYNFEAASLSVKGQLPAGVIAQEVFRARVDDATARQQIIDAARRGPKVVNYLGHGSAGTWRGDMLTSSDAAALQEFRGAVFIRDDDVLERILPRPSRRQPCRIADEVRAGWGRGGMGFVGDDNAGRAVGNQSAVVSALVREQPDAGRGGNEGKDRHERHGHSPDLDTVRRPDIKDQVILIAN